MKFLLMFLLIGNAFANDCGKTQVSSTLEKTSVEVMTDVPKHLIGAKITLTKADGSQETVKAEEFMIVKRKHTRPLMREKISSTSIQCQDSTVKNIISLRAVNSYANPDKSVNGKTGNISISRENTLGAQYQRNIGKDIFLGVEGDLNQGAGVSLGLGF